MASIVIYDPIDPIVANRVITYLSSVHTPNYDGETNKVVNPDLTALVAVHQRYWKYDGISAIVEMIQAEKDAVDSPLTTHEFQFWELNPADTTTSETWDEKMSRTAEKMSAGTYRLTWYFELKITLTGPLNSNAQARFLVDGNVKGSANLREDTEEWHAFSGWDRYIATSGEQPVLSLEIQRNPAEGGNDTIEIRKMKLGIEYMARP